MRATTRELVQVSELRTIAADTLWLSPQHHRDAVAIHFTWAPDQAAVERALAEIEAVLIPLGARPHAKDPLTFSQLDRLPYLSYTVGPVDALLRELGHPRAPDTLVESFVLGPLLLRGTRQITFVQERLARRLATTAELRQLTPPFESPTLVETMAWHPRSDNDPAHRWLRTRLRAVAHEL